MYQLESLLTIVHENILQFHGIVRLENGTIKQLKIN
jgi:hypothetical protein